MVFDVFIANTLNTSFRTCLVDSPTPRRHRIAHAPLRRVSRLAATVPTPAATMPVINVLYV